MFLAGFELRASGVRSDSSAKLITTTAPLNVSIWVIFGPPGANSIKLYGSGNYGFVVTGKF